MACVTGRDGICHAAYPKATEQMEEQVVTIALWTTQRALLVCIVVCIGAVFDAAPAVGAEETARRLTYGARAANMILSDDGTKVFFDSSLPVTGEPYTMDWEYDVFGMDVATNTIVQITRDRGDQYAQHLSDVSPDGTKLLFTAIDYAYESAWVKDLVTGIESEAGRAASDSNASFSDDSRWVSSYDSGNAWLFDFGTEETRLMSKNLIGKAGVFGEQNYTSVNTAGGYAVSTSPDGRYATFFSEDYTATGDLNDDPDLYLYDIEARRATRIQLRDIVDGWLTENDYSPYHSSPVWSADSGHLILAIPTTSSGTSKIVDVNVGTLEVTTLLDVPAPISSLDATADLSDIVFSTTAPLVEDDANASADVYRISTAGLQLVTLGAPESPAAFTGQISADGSTIAYVEAATTDAFAGGDIYLLGGARTGSKADLAVTTPNHDVETQERTPVTVPVTIQNLGTAESARGQLMLDFPPTIKVSTSLPSCRRGGSGLVCELDSIAPAASAVIDVLLEGMKAGTAQVDVKVSTANDQTVENDSVTMSFTVRREQ